MRLSYENVAGSNKPYPAEFFAKPLNGIHKTAERLVNQNPLGKGLWKRELEIRDIPGGSKTHR